MVGVGETENSIQGSYPSHTTHIMPISYFHTRLHVGPTGLPSRLAEHQHLVVSTLHASRVPNIHNRPTVHKLPWVSQPGLSLLFCFDRHDKASLIGPLFLWTGDSFRPWHMHDTAPAPPSLRELPVPKRSILVWLLEDMVVFPGCTVIWHVLPLRTSKRCGIAAGTVVTVVKSRRLGSSL